MKNKSLVKAKRMLIIGGLLGIGLVILCAGQVHAEGTVSDTGALSYYNLAGSDYTETYSNMVQITVLVGPMLSLLKQQKRNRDMSSFTQNAFTVTSQDSVTYQLRIRNYQNRDTATNLTITDTFTFWDAASNNDSLTLLVTDGTYDTTDKDSQFASANGTVTNFRYTTDTSYATWIDTTVAGLIASTDNTGGRILGLRWTIDNFAGSTTGDVDEYIYFVVRFP